jgi:uncharacterized membrane protein
VNTATQGVLKNWSDPTQVEHDVNTVGAGMLNLEAAVNAQVAVGPVSTSFGKIPHGSGQTAMADVSLSSLTGSSMDVTLSVDNATSGVAFSVGSSSVTVPATGSISVPLQVHVPKRTAPGNYQAQLDIYDGSTLIAHSMLYVFVS